MAFALSARSEAAGHRLLSLAEAGSTNEEALARAREGENGPLWIVTQRQTAGRGRRGRTWETSHGNLAASFLRVTNIAPARSATLSLVAGLATAEAVRACAPGLSLSLKWPNDVLVDHAKLAGILLESEAVPQGLTTVTGIGINVLSAPEALTYPATSLAALGRAVRAEELFLALADAWLDYEKVWDEGRGMSRIRTLWLQHAAGVGSEITVTLGDRVVSGTFESLDEQGRLLLRARDASLMPVSAGEVQVGPRAVPAGAV
jgi:BirA family biotin operon repressor/biotin-[acetyl-CoA-carboxylase] ligase